ncbi:MAG: hypothetical protein LUD03_04840 [Firmicutes bacterium]|nr:hypothetical protein [Bacillota bacterium]
MKKIFIGIICAAALLILGYGIRHAVAPVSSEPLEKTTYEQAAAASGYIIRDESIYYAERSGRLYSNARVGARVAKDSLIYTIYDSGISDSALQELSVIDSKISALNSQNSLNYTSQAASPEEEISTRIQSIIEAARDNDVSQISQYKQDINDIRAYGTASSEDQLETLTAQRDSAEGGYANSKTEVYSETSGLYLTYYDGFADKIDINDLDSCTVDYLQSLGTPESSNSTDSLVSEGDFVCSVANNHLWYTILTVETDELTSCEVGSEVSVRFKNIADEVENGTVAYISGEEQNSGGYSFVLIEFTDYFDGAFSYRAADADLIFESYTGYKIPSQAIRTQENQTYTVIARKDNKEYTCEVDVLYSSAKEGYVIVESSEDAENNLAAMDSIVTGER